MNRRYQAILERFYVTMMEGFDPLPQTSGHMGTVARAGNANRNGGGGGPGISARRSAPMRPPVAARTQPKPAAPVRPQQNITRPATPTPAAKPPVPRPQINPRGTPSSQNRPEPAQRPANGSPGTPGYNNRPESTPAKKNIWAQMAAADAAKKARENNHR